MEHYKYHPDVANNCGTILRESIKHESLARVILYGDMFWDFFDYVQGGSFDIASDAFSTFRVSQDCSRGREQQKLIKSRSS